MDALLDLPPLLRSHGHHGPGGNDAQDLVDLRELGAHSHDRLLLLLAARIRSVVGLHDGRALRLLALRASQLGLGHHDVDHQALQVHAALAEQRHDQDLVLLYEAMEVVVCRVFLLVGQLDQADQVVLPRRGPYRSQEHVLRSAGERLHLVRPHRVVRRVVLDDDAFLGPRLAGEAGRQRDLARVAGHALADVESDAVRLPVARQGPNLAELRVDEEERALLAPQDLRYVPLDDGHELPRLRGVRQVLRHLLDALVLVEVVQDAQHPLPQPDGVGEDRVEHGLRRHALEDVQGVHGDADGVAAVAADGARVLDHLFHRGLLLAQLAVVLRDARVHGHADNTLGVEGRDGLALVRNIHAAVPEVLDDEDVVRRVQGHLADDGPLHRHAHAVEAAVVVQHNLAGLGVVRPDIDAVGVDPSAQDLARQHAGHRLQHSHVSFGRVRRVLEHVQRVQDFHKHLLGRGQLVPHAHSL
mmetsp:Transcript_57499/g.166434  ORF Transcript_57499/g.166434 Transcript_57499/m.166434 type:complete len:471 (-) Transcript_57499:277-1689(-)